MRDVRERLARLGRSLYERGLSHGNTGNLSARAGEGFVVTPTGACLGEIEPEHLAVLDGHGHHTAGPVPSKETPLHLAMYRCRPQDHAVVHLHSPHAAAVSCLADLDETSVFGALTPYAVMRLGDVALVPYHPPGAAELAAAVELEAGRHHALLLANHGPIVSGASLLAAADAIEEMEATARLHLLLHGRPVRRLTDDEIGEIRRRFP